ncbi:hypothetical protein [Salegentibacter sp. UBA1130]|uniref:hypothetical protein n=1 Tax=Salegentibacter sp. UBA1130 TaxID=1947451 RepID=UPI00257DE37C|nr:hypothetical protein [Salegentibacter sp. UBA1130]
MEFEIALNTIVYLMLFLFPGILFRKFYYTAAHSKQFDQGNLFERFLWTMFSSVFMLILVIIVFFFVRTVLKLPLLESLSYVNIKNVFESLGNNQFPSVEDIEKTYFDFFIFISALYIFSIIAGFIIYFLNSRILKIFKYNNYWESIIKGSYRNKKFDPDKVYGYTSADILVETNEKPKLYSGKVVDYFLSSQNNKLETIILKDVTRWKSIYDDKGILTKTEARKVPGDNFCIDTTKSINLNLTYVSLEKNKNNTRRRLALLLDIVIWILLLGQFVILYLDIDWVVLASIPRRITFFILNIFNLLTIYAYARDFVLNKKVNWHDLPIIFIFLVPYLWLFGYVEWWVAFIIEFPVLGLVGSLIQKLKNISEKQKK